MSAEDSAQSERPADAADPFTWPPRELPRPAPIPPPEFRSPSPTLAPPQPPLVAPRLAFERVFLGLRSPPWSVRAAEAAFAPDPHASYCPRCAGPVGPGEVGGKPGDPRCGSCREARLPWSHAVRLGAWTGVLRQAILESKYARWHRLAFDLGLDLGRVLSRRLVDEDVDPSQAALVPVPMSFRRRWARGIDHTIAIARGVRAATGGRIVRPLRRRHRPPQASLPESGREANVRGCFVPKSGESLAHHTAIIVLDDVRTSGATLRAACRALAARERRLGQPLDADRVWVATLAVVTPPDRRGPPDLPREAPQDSRHDDESLIS